MRQGICCLIVLIFAARVGAAQADPTNAVAGAGIQVKGWHGRTDRSQDKITAVKFVQMGTGFHLTSGPHAVLWNGEHKASGDYTVKARITKTPKSTSSHEESYGVFIGGDDLNGSKPNYLYCVVFGTGNVMVRHRDGGDTHTLLGKTATATAAKMGERGATDEIAMWVKGGRVGCSVNGAEVFSAAAPDMIGPGKLVSTDGVFGIRASHNLDLHIEGPTVSKN